MVFLVILLAAVATGLFVCHSEATHRSLLYSKPIDFEWRNVPYHWFAVWLIGGLVAGFVLTYPALSMTQDYVPVESKISSLGDGSGVSGSFFLGSGSVESEPVFFYYSGDNTNGYRLKHVPADVTNIIETSGEPRMVRYCGDRDTAPYLIDFDLWTSEPICGDYDSVTFYVPEGSIKSNYILDSQ